ncbi:MAG TPA: SAM-dependent methyltransferase [Candidatus Binatia bacterium]|nr:SAM-dependent methyltransferase [Candidatus Binatia bacterium]
MELDELKFLFSERGQAYLQQLAAEGIDDNNHLMIASRLRRELDRQETHAVLETVLLRQRASQKFSRAQAMYFTRTALEQASAEPVARYRASRIAPMNPAAIADLGCGIGGDALALAHLAFVVGIDYDMQRLVMARENMRVYRQAHRFHPLLADLTQLPALDVDVFFADPGRRDAKGRRYSAPGDYTPPLPALLSRWLPRVPDGAVKVSPGIDYSDVPADAGLEFVSLHGEVKEGILWFGDLRDGARRRATLLPEGDTISTLDESKEPVLVTRPKQFLYEPDGAVIRAHLMRALAQKLGATRLDEEIAYLTADTAVETPFARCFLIEHAMPFHLKNLRAQLRKMQVGRVVVKKRGSPLTPEELQQRLDLDGEEEVIVFLTHVQGRPFVLIGRENCF